MSRDSSLGGGGGDWNVHGDVEWLQGIDRVQRPGSGSERRAGRWNGQRG